jgi:CheY-like chemotaxis protein
MDHGPTPTILLAHRILHTRRMMRLVLEGAGFRVVECADVEQGFDLAASTHAKAIVLEFVWEMLGELSPLAALRARPALRSIPLIAVVCDSARADNAEYRKAGFAAYVRSPIDVRRMPDVVRACLR